MRSPLTVLAAQVQAAAQTTPVGVIGVLALGAWIGFTGLLFITHGTEFGVATWGTAIGVIGGSVAVGLISRTLAGQDAFSLYFIGLVIGGVGYLVFPLIGVDITPGCQCPTPTPMPSASPATS